MMKCKCCMHTVQDGSAVCDVCKCPLLASSGVDMDLIGKQFREQLLKDCSIAVKFYHYDADELGNLVEKSADYAVVADGLSLKYHEVVWLADEFNPPEVKRDITLEICVKNAGKSITKKLTAHLDRSMKCSRLGMYLDDGLSLRFAVGSKDAYVLSDAASLLLK